MSRQIQQGIAAVLAAGSMVLALAPAFGSPPEDEELSAPDVRGIQRRVAPNEVTLAGKSLFRVPNGVGGLTAAERADVIRQRLEDIAAHYVVGAGTVDVAQTGADTFVIQVAGESLATVETTTAKAAGYGDAETLASVWADRVRETLPEARRTRQVAVEKRIRR